MQHQEIRRLRAELASVRAKLASQTITQQENMRLIAESSASAGHAQAQLRELLQLRGEVTRLRSVDQENSRLKAEQLAAAKEKQSPQWVDAASLPAEADESEKWILHAHGRFSRDLAMALIEAAAKAKRLPENLDDTVLGNDRLKEGASDYASHGLEAAKFERVYKGLWRDIKDTANTILVRQKQPVQLGNGKWIRAYGFADGHSQIVTADTADGFADKEREFGYKETNE